ncbi:MAG: hypothetical protein AAF821_09390 [Cyanobacteria bacterium P01_D01_bin.156]
MVSTLQHLFLDIQGDNQGTKPGGDPIHRIVTLHNRGERAAYLELWVEAAEQQSAGIVQWVSFDKTESELTLQPDESLDVTLTITVPLQTEAGFYGYDLRMRSSQYPGEEVRRNQQLHVLPSDQEARLRSEPRLTVTPVTDSEHPHKLKAGAALDLTLTIDNPSRRTDRFFLHCDSLPSDWFTIQYPESAAAVPGVVTFTDGLLLNPRESGEVKATIHPPRYSVAGSYYPTLRLSSKARPEITLLKVIYFTLDADEHLVLELTPNTLTIPLKNRYFDVLVHNQGNILRQLVFEGWDSEQLLRYQLSPAKVTLTPGEETYLQLVVQPRHWWQKIWRLRSRTVEFDLLAENLISDTEYIPALPQPTVGTVNLKARRRWLFFLVLISTATTAFVGLLALAWHIFIWRPSLVPKITKFNTTKESYQEGKADPIAFSWEITNPTKIRQLILTQNDTTVLELSRIFVDINENFLSEQFNERSIDTFLYPPLTQSGSCSLETRIDNPSPIEILLRIYRRAIQLPASPQYLKCRTIVPANFLTEELSPSKSSIVSLQQPTEGIYEFKLQVFTGKEHTSETKDTSSEHSQKGTFASIRRILGLGDANKQKLADKSILENVVVAAAEPPEILELKATQLEYRTVSLFTVLADTSKPALGSFSSEIIAAQNLDIAISEESNPDNSNLREDFGKQNIDTVNIDPQLVPVKLNWQISNPFDIRELRLTSLSPEGTENTEAVIYPFLYDSENVSALPELLALNEYCTFSPTTVAGEIGQVLQCNNVPTQANQVGDYVFYLTVITMDGKEESPIVETTPTVSVKPPAPFISNFAVNGRSVKQKPRHVYVLNPARGEVNVELSWDVKYAEQVELLPAPGEVVTRVDGMSYTLSAAPGVETITLRGVNELDEEITQSVMIEKVAFDQGAQPIPLQSSRRSSQAEGVSPPSGLPPLPPPPTTVLPVPEIAPIRTPPQAH